MEGLAVMLSPVALIVFAIGMERFEARLARLALPEQDVSRFLDHANTEEVAALADKGLPDALERFNRRMGRSEQTSDTSATPPAARRAS
jgi:hypothetical protein